MKFFRSILATLALAPALTLAGCGGGGPSSGDLRTLDLEAAIDNPRPFDLTDIATEIDFIPLDDSVPEALLAGVGQLAESNERYYIIDNQQHPVKVFDKSGRFVGTLGSIGRGPGEYTSANRHAVNSATGDLYVLSSNKTLTAIGADGRVFATNDSMSRMGRMAWFDNRLIFMREPVIWVYPDGGGPPPPAPDSMTTIVEIYTGDLLPDGTITSRAKGSSYAFLRGSGGVFMSINSPDILSANGTSLLMKEGLSDTVFHYLPGGVLKPALVLYHGRYAPPPEAFVTNPKVDWDRYYVTTEILHDGEHTFLTVHNGFPGSPGSLGFAFLVLDEGEGGFSATGPDGTRGLYLNGIRFFTCHMRDGRLTGYMQALDIVDNRHAITHPGLAELAETLTEDSNPVIVVARLK